MGEVTRRLAGILVADVVGYSAMMNADEATTMARVRALRTDVIDPLAAAHEGHVFKTTGDGFLVAFASAVQALRCAIAIQEKVNAEADGLRLRIGVHQGEVVQEGDDLLGAGVIVAARIEPLADPGGICISGRVREDAAGKISLVVEDLGTPQLKNISQSIQVFRVHVREPERPALPLPDKPSIAVLPFQNMSGDPEQEYFADGMVEEIITGLSRVRSFFVIARNSSFTYKGRAVDVKQVGRELGVRYVLEGSVRKAGNRVRITGQLIDAATGTHLWADRFDGGIEDVFVLQDRVTTSVVGAISPRIQAAEIERAQRKPTESLQAYDLVLRAVPHMLSLDRARLKEAVRLLRQASDIDPTYALAFARLAWCIEIPMIQGWSQPTDAELKEMVRLSRLALDHGEDDPEVLSTAAFVIGDPGGDLPAGLSLVDKALALNPNSVIALLGSGYLRVHSGDTETAIQHLEQASRLSPIERSALRNAVLSMAYMQARRYDAAIESAEKALHENPNYIASMRRLAAIYGLLGRTEEAQQMVRRLDAIIPGYTISKYRTYMEKTTAKGSALLKSLDTFCEGLRRAGLPE